MVHAAPSAHGGGNGFVLAINRFLCFARPFCHTERSRGMSTTKWVRFGDKSLFVLRTPFLSYRAQSRFEHYEMGSFCQISYSLNRIDGDCEAGMTIVETALRLRSGRPFGSGRVRGFDLQNCLALVAIGSCPLLTVVPARFGKNRWCFCECCTSSCATWLQGQMSTSAEKQHAPKSPLKGTLNQTVWPGRSSGFQPPKSSGKPFTIFTVSKLTCTTCPTRSTMYSGSSLRLGSLLMPERLSTLTRY